MKLIMLTEHIETELCSNDYRFGDKIRVIAKEWHKLHDKIFYVHWVSKHFVHVAESVDATICSYFGVSQIEKFHNEADQPLMDFACAVSMRTWRKMYIEEDSI